MTYTKKMKTKPHENKKGGMMKRKILTNDEFLNMLDGILPENDRSKLIECYPEEEQANGEKEDESKKD